MGSGKITCNEVPLPDCQIKLQILEKGGLLTKGYHPIEGAVAFETNTDKDGMYHIMNVPTRFVQGYIGSLPEKRPGSDGSRWSRTSLWRQAKQRIPRLLKRRSGR